MAHRLQKQVSRGRHLLAQIHAQRPESRAPGPLGLPSGTRVFTAKSEQQLQLTSSLLLPSPSIFHRAARVTWSLARIPPLHSIPGQNSR